MASRVGRVLAAGVAMVSSWNGVGRPAAGGAARSVPNRGPARQQHAYLSGMRFNP